MATKYIYYENGAHNPDTVDHDETHMQQAIITGIRVFWTDFVVGIETFYNGQSAGAFYGSEINSPNKKENSLMLESNEHISHIRGRCGNCVDQLTVYTTRGRTVTFGESTGGNEFQLQGGPDKVIRHFKTGTGGHLHYIGAYFGPVPSLYAPFPSGMVGTAEKIGGQHPDTTHFDDYNQFVKTRPGPAKICEVRLFQNHDFVYGLEIFYQFPDGNVQSAGPHVGQPLPISVQNFAIRLAPDEEIIEITARGGSWVDHMRIVTSKGQVLQGGGQGGQPFKVNMPHGHRVAAFAGGIGGHLHNFIVYHA